MNRLVLVIYLEIQQIFKLLLIDFFFMLYSRTHNNCRQVRQVFLIKFVVKTCRKLLIKNLNMKWGFDYNCLLFEMCCNFKNCWHFFRCSTYIIDYSLNLKKNYTPIEKKWAKVFINKTNVLAFFYVIDVRIML